MKNLLSSGATIPFAHLLGVSRASSRAAEDDQPEDDDKTKGKKAADDTPDDEDQPKGKKAEGDDPKDDDEPKGKKAEGDDKDPEDDDEPKGKKARADEDGDDDSDEDEMVKGSSARSARLRERARCAAIFSDAAAGANPALAASLAFNTNLTRSQAIAALRSGGAAPAARRNSLDERMSRVPRSNTGPGGGSDKPLSVAQKIVAAANKVRGEA